MINIPLKGEIGYIFFKKRNKNLILDRIYRIKQDKKYLKINPVNPVKFL